MSLKVLSLYKYIITLSWTTWSFKRVITLPFLFRSRFSALRPKINHFRIYKKCYFPVKFVVRLIIFVNDCRSLSYVITRKFNYISSLVIRRMKVHSKCLSVVHTRAINLFALTFQSFYLIRFSVHREENCTLYVFPRRISKRIYQNFFIYSLWIFATSKRCRFLFKN